MFVTCETSSQHYSYVQFTWDCSPGRFRDASSLTLLVPLLRNSGPLNSSLVSLATGSGFTTTVPVNIDVRRSIRMTEWTWEDFSRGCLPCGSLLMSTLLCALSAAAGGSPSLSDPSTAVCFVTNEGFLQFRKEKTFIITTIPIRSQRPRPRTWIYSMYPFIYNAVNEWKLI